MKLKEMEKWQLKRLIFSLLVVGLGGIIYLIFTTTTLHNDRMNEEVSWKTGFDSTDKAKATVEKYAGNATHVTTGSYIENIKEINLKSGSYRLEMLVWFRWTGDNELDMANNVRFYKGTMNKMSIVKDSHEGDENYQLLRCDVSFTKNYWARRFPLESHQLRMYLESQYPVDRVMLDADKENSGLNPNLSIVGYDVKRSEVGSMAMSYDNSHNDPDYPDDGITTSEFVTALEIVRDGWGLYLKCFIALAGTTTWVLITLFLSTYHRVDPLSMIPAALFGTVSNIMVGANLLPDALQTGLLEYVNIWGIFTILAVAIAIININRIRNKYEDRAFAGLYGKIMFYTILVLILAGHILLPLSATYL